MAAVPIIGMGTSKYSRGIKAGSIGMSFGRQKHIPRRVPGFGWVIKEY